MIRVLIVDDSSFVRRAVRRMLTSEPGFEVVGEAKDGRSALAEVERLAPDVVTLDLHMPGLDGVVTLEALMAARPTPVVLFSSHAQEDAMLTLRALAAGAVDFVDKSRASAMEVYELAPELIAKVRAAAGSRPRAPSEGEIRWHAEPAREPPRLVVLGASTGGPIALEAILAAMPPIAAPVLVVQHMPTGFTSALARRLGAKCAMPVREGAADDELAPGAVIVAPGGHEVVVVVDEQGRLRHRAVPAAGRALPRLDVVLYSAVAACGAAICLAVLTGMGNDGQAGAKNVRAAGGTVIAQAAATCAVYGMPRAVVDAGLATCVAPPAAIAGVIARLATASAPKGAA